MACRPGAPWDGAAVGRNDQKRCCHAGLIPLLKVMGILRIDIMLATGIADRVPHRTRIAQICAHHQRRLTRERTAPIGYARSSALLLLSDSPRFYVLHCFTWR